MNFFELKDISIDNIDICVSVNDDVVKVEFEGDMDMIDPDLSILPYFLEIHDKIIENSIKKIQLDFLNLSFLNSSGIKVLIKWVQRDLVLSKDNRYCFELLANSRIPWQSNSLRILQMLAPDIIKITVIN